jgi:hypothetical protein
MKPVLAGCAVGVLVAFCACSAPSRYYLADNYAKQRLRRVALLVNRMASRYPGDVGRVSLETDYARRVPRKPNAWGLNEEEINAYIEEEGRLRESVPNYPAFEKRERFNEEAAYFGNLSPELYAAVRDALAAKGYEVVDLRAAMSAWSPSFTEMTVSQILTRLGGSGTVDAVLILHYVDVQQRSYHYYMGSRVDYGAYTETTRADFGGADAGFSKLHYTLAMFDVSTRERVLVYHEGDGIGLTKPEHAGARDAIVADLGAQVRKWVEQALP